MKFNVRDNLREYYEVHLFVQGENYWTALKIDEYKTQIETKSEAIEKLAVAKEAYIGAEFRVVRYSPAIIHAT